MFILCGVDRKGAEFIGSKHAYSLIYLHTYYISLQMQIVTRTRLTDDFVCSNRLLKILQCFDTSWLGYRNCAWPLKLSHRQSRKVL